MYIVVSGVHGIGKTTLARDIAAKLNAEYLTETIDESIPPPVLGPGGNVVLAELWMSRQTLMKESQIRSSSGIYVADRSWADIYTYSRALLAGNELAVLLHALDHLPKKTPDVHLIVHAPTETIRERILGRARTESRAWSEDDTEYIERVQNGFIDYHRAFSGLRPIHLVDAAGDRAENLDRAIGVLSAYLPGVYDARQ